MVSFTCCRCQDVVRKPKVAPHSAQCGGEHFTCVDCMKTFDLQSIRTHQSCVSETEKYQGKYLGKYQGGQPRAGPGPGEDRKTRRPALSFSDTDISSGDDGPAAGRPRRGVRRRLETGHPATRLHAAETSDEEAGATAPGPPAAAPTAAPAAAHNGRGRPRASAHSPRLTPAVTPAATAAPAVAPAAEVCVSLSLGPLDTVLDVGGRVMDAAGAASMAPRAMARGLADAYAKRIRGAIRRALLQGLEADPRPATPHVVIDAAGILSRAS